jgi:hypothetical protein
MTRTERQDLLQICRQRERVAKTEAVAVAARQKADFQAQLARIYSFDESTVWKAAAEAQRRCNEQIAADCAKLSIPRWVQPELAYPYWRGRGENAVAQRRAELTRVGEPEDRPAPEGDGARDPAVVGGHPD